MNIHSAMLESIQTKGFIVKYKNIIQTKKFIHHSMAGLLLISSFEILCSAVGQAAIFEPDGVFSFSHDICTLYKDNS